MRFVVVPRQPIRIKEKTPYGKMVDAMTDEGDPWDVWYHEWLDRLMDDNGWLKPQRRARHFRKLEKLVSKFSCEDGKIPCGEIIPVDEDVFSSVVEVIENPSAGWTQSVIRQLRDYLESWIDATDELSAAKKIAADINGEGEGTEDRGNEVKEDDQG